MARPLQLGFQDATSPTMEELLHFHDHAMTTVFLISALVLYIIAVVISAKLTNKLLLDSQVMEILWTILPSLILIIIALPSLRILYFMEEINTPHLTIKTVGHQWYWSYEYTDYEDLEFDSYMTPMEELTPGQFRLLESDYHTVVPLQSPIRMLVSAADVLHAWTLPSFGVKVDAVPGRLNQMTFIPYWPGVYYGQCSEICGAYHSFMPIVVEVVPLEDFELWSSTSSD